MRFQVDQTLFAVHFGHIGQNPRIYGFFSQPLLFNDIMPSEINFNKLTVMEHHKVPDCHDETQKLDCDGYLLKDDTGKTFANQYPTASYGQLSDEGNRRFSIYITKEGSLTKQMDEDPKSIFEYHLLSDVLERIQRGIKDLSEVPDTDVRYQFCKDKYESLVKLYDRIVKEFGEKYPDYQLNMAWKPLMKTDLLRPDVTFHRRVAVDKAKAMSKEDIVKDFNSDGRFEIEYTNGDCLVIEKAEGAYYIDGKMTDVNTINVFYGEKDENYGKTMFFIHQTEYFPLSWVESAAECFIKRSQNGSSIVATRMGMSIEAVAAKDKEAEGIAQVRC